MRNHIIIHNAIRKMSCQSMKITKQRKPIISNHFEKKIYKLLLLITILFRVSHFFLIYRREKKSKDPLNGINCIFK